MSGSLALMHDGQTEAPLGARRPLGRVPGWSGWLRHQALVYRRLDPKTDSVRGCIPEPHRIDLSGFNQVLLASLIPRNFLLQRYNDGCTSRCWKIGMSLH